MTINVASLLHIHADDFASVLVAASLKEIAIRSQYILFVSLHYDTIQILSSPNVFRYFLF